MGLDQDILEQVSGALGEQITVAGVVVTPAGKRRVARIIVERAAPDLVGATPVEPLTLDEVADATRTINESLDSSDVMGSQPYTLEVSTPGVDRPLTEPVHFRRAVSRLVELTLADRSVTGRVLATTGDGVELEVAGTKQQGPRAETIPFTDITSGVVQVEFNRPQSTPETDGETEA